MIQNWKTPAFFLEANWRSSRYRRQRDSRQDFPEHYVITHRSQILAESAIIRMALRQFLLEQRRRSHRAARKGRMQQVKVNDEANPKEEQLASSGRAA